MVVFREVVKLKKHTFKGSVIFCAVVLVAALLGPTVAQEVDTAPALTQACPPVQPPAKEAVKTPAKAHPRHDVKVWKSRYRGRAFQVVQLPRCEHLEAVITHEPCGETLARAKRRMGGVAACTGSFHNPRSMDLADFLQRDGEIESHASTGRWFLSIMENGELDIANNYMQVKGRSDVNVVTLGQRLVPLHRDKFSKAFMNRVTDRMALGLSENYIYIVQGRTNIWRLAQFMEQKLQVESAINSDGGHVVRGRAPVHIVFRWRSG